MRCQTIAAFFVLLCAQCALACDQNLPLNGVRDDVLVIVNDNAQDSCEVGRYYAEKRQLGRSNILHIKAPVSYFIDWNQFQVIREQVFRALIDKITAVDPSFVLSSCATATSNYCADAVAQVRSKTAVKILVTTWGIPSRIVDIPGDGQPSSLDDYLRMSLVNYIVGSSTFPTINVSVRRTQIEAGGYRQVDPAIDNELVVGRVDGVTAAAAKQLVDRAIAVEANGFYGRAFWDVSNSLSSFDGRFPTWLYAPTAGNGFVSENIGGANQGAQAAWRYTFGLFDENRDQCVGYSSLYLNSSTKAPAECKVKLENAGHFGEPYSHAQIVDNAAIYLGNQDGQPTYYASLPFATLLNWHRAAAIPGSPVSCGLCQDSQCRAASTDTFKEIDTRCAGVADGFIGYNFQSWPVSYLASWPTGWYMTNPGGANWYDQSGGDNGYMALPEVVADSHDAVGGALYFGHSKALAASINCYTDNSLSTQSPCVQKQTVLFGQMVGLSPFQYAANTEFELKFWYKRTSLVAVRSDDGLSVQLHMNAQDSSTAAYKEYNYGVMHIGGGNGLALPANDTQCLDQWCQATFNLVLDPALAGHTGTDYSTINYSGLKFILATNQRQGDIEFDDFSLVKKLNGVAAAVALTNPSFDAGHQQFSTGDFAASYLSRLNGAAFFGSMSHHRTSGFSFSGTAGDSIMRIFKGMPLGEAVWLGNGGGGSGVLYGDPLYSPLAIALFSVPSPVMQGTPITLRADVLNGTDTNNVTTSYSVEYCYSTDFYLCDHTPNAWLASNLSGQQRGKNILLGNLDTSSMSTGQWIILRLSVTSANLVSGASQVFHDFSKPIIIYVASADTDNDGLTDGEEVALGTNLAKADTDGDGYPDGYEVHNGLDPLNRVDGDRDSDADFISDGQEFLNGTNPHNIDSDGDGYSDFIETYFGGAANNPNIHPDLGFTAPPLYAAVNHLYSAVLQKTNPSSQLELVYGPVGMQLMPGDILEWTPAANQVGTQFVNLQLDGVPQPIDIHVLPVDGDLNGDGKLDIRDIQAMRKILMGQLQPTLPQTLRADFYQPIPNDPAALDISDLILMQKKFLQTP